MSILFANPHELAGSNPKPELRSAPVARFGGLLVLPVLERSALRWTAAAAGSALIYCGVSGSRGAFRVLGAKHSRHPTQQLRESITIGKTAPEFYAL